MASSLSTSTTIFYLALVFALITPSFARHNEHHHHHGHHHHHHHHHHRGHNALIDELCSKTTNQSLCVTLLRSDWHSQTADERGLIEIAIDSAFNKATSIYKDLNKIYDKTRVFDLKRNYRSASKNYNDAIRDLVITKKYLKENDYSSIVVQVTDSAEELKDVRVTLNDQRVSTELKDRNRELEVLVDLIRVSAEHIVKKH